MAEGGQNVSSLPLPPMQYVNLYTDDNVKRGRAPQPPPPMQDAYSMFGQPISCDDAIIQSLESQGLKRLYPTAYDHKRELKKLNHSVLVNFLDLLDIFIKCPESVKRTEKISDMNLLFIHMHHLVNEFRPHQARETLRVMLEMQKRNRLDTIDRLSKHLDKVQELVEECVRNLPEPDLDNKLMVNTESMNVDMDGAGVNSQPQGVDERDSMLTGDVEEMSIT